MVNKQILKEYEDADYDYIHSAHDLAEIKFKQMTEHLPIKTYITKITRVKFPNGKEYFYYEERREGKDHVGNEQHFTDTIGRYRKPIFHKEYDPSTRKIVGNSISRHEMVYEIPFSKKKLESVAAKGVENEMTLYVEAGGHKRYRIFSYEDFRDRTYEELLTMGKSGKTAVELFPGQTSTHTPNSKDSQQQ